MRHHRIVHRVACACQPAHRVERAAIAGSGRQRLLQQSETFLGPPGPAERFGHDLIGPMPFLDIIGIFFGQHQRFVRTAEAPQPLDPLRIAPAGGREIFRRLDIRQRGFQIAHHSVEFRTGEIGVLVRLDGERRIVIRQRAFVIECPLAERSAIEIGRRIVRIRLLDQIGVDLFHRRQTAAILAVFPRAHRAFGSDQQRQGALVPRRFAPGGRDLLGRDFGAGAAIGLRDGQFPVVQPRGRRQLNARDNGIDRIAIAQREGVGLFRQQHFDLRAVIERVIDPQRNVPPRRARPVGIDRKIRCGLRGSG